MKVLFTLTTMGYERYAIWTGGHIQRLDMPFTPSERWRLVGLREVRGNGFVPLASIGESLPLLFKNGKPRYTVEDVDNGSLRQWGNTDYQGVRELRFA